jgi:hypothetical protein
MESAVIQQFPSQQTDGSSRGLVTKLIAAIQEIQLIPKRGVNSFSNYSYATAEDIIQAVRGPLSRNGLLVFSSLRDRTSETITTAQGKPAFRERITLRFVITDGESELHFDAPGEGQDTGDKGIYKALTGATKYALRSLLQLPIGDDPEADAQDLQRAQAKPQPPLVMPKPPLSPPPTPSDQHRDVVGPPRITERQLKAIQALSRAQQVDESHLREVISRRFGTDDLEALTRSQASQVLNLLKAEETHLPTPQ